jgi:hypothetical protein
MRALWLLVIGGWLLLLVAVALLAGLNVPPAGAGALATPVEVTNWPTPMPTAVPVPTHCAPITAGGTAICGVAVVPVSNGEGTQGLLLLLVAVNIFGFGLVAIMGLVYGWVRR